MEDEVGEFLIMITKEMNEKYVKRIKNDFNNFKLREAEVLLVKNALVIANTYTSIIIKLSLDKEVYTTNEVIDLSLNIDSTPLLEILKQDFYNYDIKELKINKIGIILSDNLTYQRRPELPIFIEGIQRNQTNILIKPHFQMENSFIGPISLDFEINGNLIFKYEISQLLKPNLKSPPSSLNISIKNLKPPLIDQSFPLEVLIENKSEGEALNLNIELVFPEQIKIMRGTLTKQIYSLRSNDSIKWEINLKPTEAGDYVIKIKSKFNDSDQKLIEATKEFPFPIKL